MPTEIHRVRELPAPIKVYDFFFRIPYFLPIPGKSKTFNQAMSATEQQQQPQKRAHPAEENGGDEVAMKAKKVDNGEVAATQNDVNSNADKLKAKIANKAAEQEEQEEQGEGGEEESDAESGAGDEEEEQDDEEDDDEVGAEGEDDDDDEVGDDDEGEGEGDEEEEEEEEEE